MAQTSTASELAAKLHRDGYVIVQGVCPNLRGDLEAAFQAFPEFKHHPSFAEMAGNRVYVCGGTSFCSSPSVFHNEAAQRFRSSSAAHMMPIMTRFLPLLGNPDLKLARYLDRIQARPAGVSATSENWHRDAPPLHAAGEFWTGGFQNCNETPMKFCAIKGSHIFDSPSEGFAGIPKEEHPALNARLLAQANQEDTDEKGNIVVPPGHLIIFISTLAHQVYGKAEKEASVKIFLGFRITPYDGSGVYVNKEVLPVAAVQQMMTENAVMVLPSGQIPPMYPALYLCNQQNLTNKFLPFERDMLVEGGMRMPLLDAAGKIQHKARREGDRSMKSLAELGLPVTAYHEAELAAVVPQKDVRILNFKTGEVETFSLMYEGAAFPTPDQEYVIAPPYEAAKPVKVAKPRGGKETKKTGSISPY